MGGGMRKRNKLDTMGNFVIVYKATLKNTGWLVVIDRAFFR